LKTTRIVMILWVIRKTRTINYTAVAGRVHKARIKIGPRGNEQPMRNQYQSIKESLGKRRTELLPINGAEKKHDCFSAGVQGPGALAAPGTRDCVYLKLFEKGLWQLFTGRENCKRGESQLLTHQDNQEEKGVGGEPATVPAKKRSREHLRASGRHRRRRKPPPTPTPPPKTTPPHTPPQQEPPPTPPPTAPPPRDADSYSADQQRLSKGEKEEASRG